MTKTELASELALKPCPFCGEAAELGEDNDPVYRWAVRAPHTHDCFLAYSNANRHRSYATEAEAIAAWNDRPTNPAAPADGLREAFIEKGVAKVMSGLPSHVEAWREAIIIARDHNDDSDDPETERAYWNQHLRKFDWLFATVRGVKRDVVPTCQTGWKQVPDDCPVCGPKGPCIYDKDGELIDTALNEVPDPRDEDIPDITEDQWERFMAAAPRPSTRLTALSEARSCCEAEREGERLVARTAYERGYRKGFDDGQAGLAAAVEAAVRGAD